MPGVRRMRTVEESAAPVLECRGGAEPAAEHLEANGRILTLRRLKPEEHSHTRALYEEAFFQDTKEFVDYYYRRKASRNEIYAALDEQGIYGMAHLNPVPVNWRGREQVIHYIVAVATQERFRRQGIMGELLRMVLRDMSRRGEPFAFLMPAAEAIYSPYGFRRAWEWRWEEEPDRTREVNALGKNDETGETAAPGEPDRAKESNTPEPESGTNGVAGGKKPGEAPALNGGELLTRPAAQCSDEILKELSQAVNERLMEQFDLFALRSPDYYRNLEEQQEASKGQLLIGFQGEKPWAAVCTEKENFPPMMTRIVNLERFLAGVRTREEQDFLWEVRDEIIPENNGIFRVSLGPEGGRAVRLGDGRTVEKDRHKRGWDGGQPDRPEGTEGLSAGTFLRAAQTPEECLDIFQIPQRLGPNNPFLRAMICEVV